VAALAGAVAAVTAPAAAVAVATPTAVTVVAVATVTAATTAAPTGELGGHEVGVVVARRCEQLEALGLAAGGLGRDDGDDFDALEVALDLGPQDVTYRSALG
jgi:hypothetical protein